MKVQKNQSDQTKGDSFSWDDMAKSIENYLNLSSKSLADSK
jgi:hypothetical protein